MGRVEKRVSLGDGHSLCRLSDLDDLVTGGDVAFAKNPEVESRPSARRQQSWHPRLVHPNADAIAGHARLRDLKKRAADLIAIADAHRIVRQSVDGEVFAELSVDEVVSFQLLLPVAIRLELIDEDGALLAPMSGDVALAISVNIEPPHPTASAHGILPDPCMNNTPLPLDVLWTSDVHRYESGRAASGAHHVFVVPTASGVPGDTASHHHSCSANTCACVFPYG